MFVGGGAVAPTSELPEQCLAFLRVCVDIRGGCFLWVKVEAVTRLGFWVDPMDRQCSSNLKVACHQVLPSPIGPHHHNSLGGRRKSYVFCTSSGNSVNWEPRQGQGATRRRLIILGDRRTII